ncbi:phage tail protein [Mesorhizobium sp. C280B]|uniref:hypothetical protein n=1 Tax=unclassified Mesorhizobium TaxID=325217 RepID=UPI0003CF16E2|nr:hypothetical protein [Mesorhizobium sp. LSJC280B00]ESW92916.1 hypothetical protein X772_02855 [Mesorhizobium sp. LSJC280B00]
MASELIVGVKHLRDGIEAQAVLGADMSVIGIIGTAPAADAAAFPLDTAVVLYTNDTALRALLGTTGTLVDALAGISAQLGGGVGAARCVIVRVTDNASAATVIASMLGSEANGTGVWAFLDAPEELGVTPRLLIAPGYTSQTVSGLVFGAITAPGSLGTNGTFALAFTGGTGSGAAGTFTVAGGALTAVAITNPGSYTVAPTLSFAASANLVGATATITLEQLANAVVAIMPTICERLKAMFLPEGPTNTRAAAVDWLETIPRTQRILHPLRQDAKILDGSGNVVTKPLSPYIVGLYVRRDAQSDGVPGHSVANQQVFGIVGVTPIIPFSITDPAVVGQDDLAISFGIMFRGDTGVDGALTDGGFTFWGTDTLSQESEWLFANVCRMRDYIELMQVRAVRTYLGRYNLTAQTVQAIINTLDTQLRGFKANGDILDYRIEFDPDVNTPSELRLGNIDLTFKAEEPPVLRKITIRSRRYAEALDGLVRSISIQLGNQEVA